VNQVSLQTVVYVCRKEVAQLSVISRGVMRKMASVPVASLVSKRQIMETVQSPADASSQHLRVVRTVLAPVLVEIARVAVPQATYVIRLVAVKQ